MPGIPRPIGTFSAAVEAILAVEVYEDGATPGPVADPAAARGFAGWGSELVLVLPGREECVPEVGPDAVSLRIGAAAHGPVTMGEFEACRRRQPNSGHPTGAGVAHLGRHAGPFACAGQLARGCVTVSS